MPMRPFLAAVALVTLAGASVGRAEEAYDAPTRAAIQAVVTKQIEALSHDDPGAAEALASPAIRQKFPTPDKFFDMVKQNYAALVRPKSTQFTETAPSPHGPLQKMTIVAADGSIWTAIYSFTQVDGAWRITGCGIERDKKQQDI